jgi:alpha-L-rhamnosidase
MKRVLWLTVLLISPALAQGPVNPRLLAARWPAQWIAAPGTAPFDYGVYHFRKSLDLPEAPGHFVVHVSADNRYRLFVNGRSVAAGPPQSDLRNWRFNTIDLGPYLKPDETCSPRWSGMAENIAPWRKSRTARASSCKGIPSASRR